MLAHIFEGKYLSHAAPMLAHTTRIVVQRFAGHQNGAVIFKNFDGDVGNVRREVNEAGRELILQMADETSVVIISG